MKEINIRRSIRRYTGEKVTNEEVDKLLRAAMQAPSAGNQQAWEFLVVRDKAMLEKVAEVSPYAGMVKDADVAIIPLVNENHLKFNDYWEQDLSAATQNILLEAVSLNLGAVWLGVAPLVERTDYISHIFDLPDFIKAFAVIPVGKPVGENKFIDRFDSTRIHYDKY